MDIIHIRDLFKNIAYPGCPRTMAAGNEDRSLFNCIQLHGVKTLLFYPIYVHIINTIKTILNNLVFSPFTYFSFYSSSNLKFASKLVFLVQIFLINCVSSDIFLFVHQIKQTHNHITENQSGCIQLSNL